MNYTGKSKHVYRNKKLRNKYCLLLFSDVIIQTNKFFIFRYLLNFKTKCIGGEIKTFSFLFCTACDTKSTVGGERYIQSGEHYLQSVAKQGKREQTHPLCLNTVAKYEKVESINTQNDYKTTSKK